MNVLTCYLLLLYALLRCYTRWVGGSVARVLYMLLLLYTTDVCSTTNNVVLHGALVCLFFTTGGVATLWVICRTYFHGTFIFLPIYRPR